ncbi:uncharacterized protein LOC122526046 [Polistes fuscatus]|nr:uncharacterized protein LOC122526046 [Polistes fuscatus]
MLKALISFGLGVYTGLYLNQNYEIPKVDDPTKILERLKEIADDYRKK